MSSFNSQLYDLVGVTETDFRRWCKENNKNVSSPASKREFFTKIQDGRLAKDQMTGKIVKVRVRRKK